MRDAAHFLDGAVDALRALLDDSERIGRTAAHLGGGEVEHIAGGDHRLRNAVMQFARDPAALFFLSSQ